MQKPLYVIVAAVILWASHPTSSRHRWWTCGRGSCGTFAAAAWRPSPPSRSVAQSPGRIAACGSLTCTAFCAPCWTVRLFGGRQAARLLPSLAAECEGRESQGAAWRRWLLFFRGRLMNCWRGAGSQGGFRRRQAGAARRELGGENQSPPGRLCGGRCAASPSFRPRR